MRDARALPPARHKRLRALVLLVTAALALMRGVSYLPAEEPLAVDQLSYVEAWLPLHVWGWLWVAVAGALTVATVCRRLAVPAMTGFVFLALMWGTSYLASWWLLDEPTSALTGVVTLTVAMYAAVLTTLIERPVRKA